MKERTWKVIKMGIKPAASISLCCPNCMTDAAMPIANTECPVIASLGLGLVFDNPNYNPKHQVLPLKVQCRNCRSVFSQK